MREHPEAAREYEALKLRLWKEYEYDRDGYTEQKTVMVARFTGDAKTLYPGRYKRQALEFARAEPEDTKALRRLARASEAVSYTHLDVYKRQIRLPTGRKSCLS